MTVDSRMIYQGRWWETLHLDYPTLKFVSRSFILVTEEVELTTPALQSKWSDRQVADFRG